MKKEKTGRWVFQLYVTDRTTKSVAALLNLKAICNECLGDPYDLEVIDLLVHPERAMTDNIVAVPTLVKTAPTPGRRMVGDLSNRSRTLAWLGLNQPASPRGKQTGREGNRIRADRSHMAMRTSHG